MDPHKYWPAIQQKVCRRCVDGDGNGNCRLGPSRECELKEYFPLICSVVDGVSSDHILDYIIPLRVNVCTECSHQTPDGQCRFREKVDCALDRYYPLIVQAIEEIKQLESAGRKVV